MTVSSMTGFARTEGGVDGARWVWEIRSVNNRALDLKVRLPSGSEVLEAAVRSALAVSCKRGSVTVSLVVTDAARNPVLRINEGVLSSLLDLMRQLEGRVDAAPPRLDGLLGLRGVIEVAESPADPVADAARQAEIEAGLHAAVAQLAAVRSGEGSRLANLLSEQLGEMERLVEAASTAAASQPALIAQRLRDRLADLLDAQQGLSAERLAQEVALLASRADVREELDRLNSHIEAARCLLREAGAIGRRLDFLMQEFNREANTLCSKSSDLELTRLGLALKAAIEQMREQVQNIE